MNEMYRLRKDEIKRSGIKPHQSAYDTSIVYLSPNYKEDGSRMISAENISTSTRLNEIINDINLMPVSNTKKVNAYFEDEHAMGFAKFLLKQYCDVNLENYINFVDVNLGWTNYLQLYKKRIPEFLNSVINLDADVPNKREYAVERTVVENASNILFLPVEIERGLFEFFKNHANYINFERNYSNVPTLTYDICFRDWPLEIEEYDIEELKKWYAYFVGFLGGPEQIYKCWIDSNQESAKGYAAKFIDIYNTLSDVFELDQIAPIT
jgi:hypothetical protein